MELDDGAERWSCRIQMDHRQSRGRGVRQGGPSGAPLPAVQGSVRVLDQLQRGPTAWRTLSSAWGPRAPCVVCLTHDLFSWGFGFLVGVFQFRLAGCPPCSFTHLVLRRLLCLGLTLRPCSLSLTPLCAPLPPLSPSLLFCKLTFWVSLGLPRFLSSAWPSALFPSLGTEFPTGPAYMGPERS